MSLSPSSTSQSLVEAFDPEGASGHLKADLVPVDECVFDLGCIAATCEDSPAAVQTGLKAVEDVDGSGEGRLRDERGLSSPPCPGSSSNALTSPFTLFL